MAGQNDFLPLRGRDFSRNHIVLFEDEHIHPSSFLFGKDREAIGINRDREGAQYPHTDLDLFDWRPGH